MEPQDRVEIRLLGRLYVRRTDGTVVAPDEWRTSKTVNLLRILALQAGRPVRTDFLLETLWPEADAAHGRASLRTAASQIRRTLHADCLERQMDGLVLNDVWVDVLSYRSLAAEAKVCQRAGDLARVVALAREAEGLYVADLWSADDSDWAVEAREGLVALRRKFLSDAASSAAQLHWMRDAIDLAHRTLAVDPCSEEPHRVLMQAYAGLGEVQKSLSIFEQCRTMLAEELGADPSPQTRALHLQILTDGAPAREESGYVGGSGQVAGLAHLVERSLRRGDDTVVLVSGAAGSGREALIAQAASTLGQELVTVRPRAASGVPTSEELLESVRGMQKCVVTMPPLHGLGAAGPCDVARAVHTLAESGRCSAVVAIPVSPAESRRLRDACKAAGVRHTVLKVEPLSRPQLGELASVVLSAPVSPQLVTELHEETDGLAGAAAATLRGWLAEGQVVWTRRGLEHVASTAADLATDAAQVIRTVLEHLRSDDLDLVQLLALTEGAVTADTLKNLLGEDRDPVRIQTALDLLVDDGLLELTTLGYTFRHPLMRDGVESWLRPGVRRRLHRQIAGASTLEAETRAQHWLYAGDHQRACQTMLDAALGASTHDLPRARGYVETAVSYAHALQGAPVTLARTLEDVGDTATTLLMHEVALESFQRALAAERSSGGDGLDRLTAKVRRCRHEGAADSAGSTDAPRIAGAVEFTGADGWEATLQDHVRTLLVGADPALTWELRLSLVPKSDSKKTAPVTDEPHLRLVLVQDETVPATAVPSQRQAARRRAVG